MAERRRRRRLSGSDDGSDDDLLSSDNSQDRDARSDCESETGHDKDFKKSNDDENSDEYESAEDHRSQGEEGDDDEYTDEEEGSEQDEGNVKEERTRGDGQEEKQLDTDQDRQNPQYIPRKGPYFEHDVRYTDENKDGRSARPNIRKKLWKESEKWAHDMYREDEQAPKSREEIVMVYGFDMRSSDHNQRGYPRPYRGRGQRGRGGGRRPQYKDNRDYYSNRSDNYSRDQDYRNDNRQRYQRQEDYHQDQRPERSYRNQRNSYQSDQGGEGYKSQRSDNRHWNQQGDAYINEDYRKEQPARNSQSVSDKETIRSYPRTREWTNTNYKKQREQLYHEQEERNDRNAHYSNRTNVSRGREVKSYSKERRRPPAAKSQEEDVVETETASVDKETTGLEESLEKLTIKVESSHHGEGDTTITRTITNEAAHKPASNNYPNVPQQEMKQPRHTPPKPVQRGGSHARQEGSAPSKSSPQRGGHSRPKRYSSQRQRQMPEAAPPPAMHLPALMEGPARGPQFYDPGFQGPMYHPNANPPTTLDGTPPPPPGPPHTGQPPPPPPGDHMMRQGMMVQHEMNMHPGMQHPSQPHMPVPNPNMYTPVSMAAQPPPPPPPVGTYAPAFVSQGVVNYSVPPGPAYQMAPPVPVSAPIPTPAPAPAQVPVPVPMQQYPVKQPPQGQMYGGVTYYSTEQQRRVQRAPPRRPINRIPIQPPPESENAKKGDQKASHEDMSHPQEMALQSQEVTQQPQEVMAPPDDVSEVQSEHAMQQQQQQVDEQEWRQSDDQTWQENKDDWQDVGEQQSEQSEVQATVTTDEQQNQDSQPQTERTQSPLPKEAEKPEQQESQQEVEQPVQQTQQRGEREQQKVEQPVQAHLQVEEIVQLEEQQPLQ